MYNKIFFDQNQGLEMRFLTYHDLTVRVAPNRVNIEKITFKISLINLNSIK